MTINYQTTYTNQSFSLYGQGQSCNPVGRRSVPLKWITHHWHHCQSLTFIMYVYISSLLICTAAHNRTGPNGQALLAMRLAGVGATGIDGRVCVADLELA